MTHTLPIVVEEQDEISEDDLVRYIEGKLSEGFSTREIIGALIELGMPQEEAYELVIETASAMPSEQRRSARSRNKKRKTSMKYGGHMAVGGLVCFIGLAVTIFTIAASSGGGVIVVAWGAILFGGIDFLYGLFGWMLSPK